MALKPITVYICKKYSDEVWDGKKFFSDPQVKAIYDAIQLVASEMGLSAADGDIYYLRYFGDAIDQQLRVQSYQLPQVLISTPDPNNSAPGAQVFLAKLVQGQITKENLKTIITAVRKLVPKVDPTGSVSFYDPTFDPFKDASIGISNISGAPGKGSLIGLNPLHENLEINRGGQVIGNFFDILKKIAPFLAVGAVYYGYKSYKNG